MKHRFFSLLIGSLLLVTSSHAAVDGNTLLKPFTMAQVVNGKSLNDVASSVKQKLTKNGFQIIGQYQPYDTTLIYIVTSNALKQVAAKTKYGGFGAALRVSVTKVGNQVQVAHNNPTYIGIAYRMGSELASTKQAFAKALGFVKYFGGGEGVMASKLPHYNYTFGLEDFSGFYEFKTYKNYQEAVKAVDSKLTTGKYGISKVYRLDIPGKQQTVFGLSLNSNPDEEPFLNDQYVMKIIDHLPNKRSAHLPYEMMVNGNKVIVLHAHYRLAINFPELKMFGKNSFGKLMDLPYDYDEYFSKLLGADWPRSQDW